MSFVGSSSGMASLGAVGVAPAAAMLGAAPTPDPDAIKLFVGQIPRNQDEAELRQIFEQYGTVCDMKVLRDAYSGFHRGCCFVTFQKRSEAQQCISALHDKIALTGMSRKLQVKPADENKMEKRKLFVGMLPKDYESCDLQALLSPYGTVEECNILKDDNGISKSCGFALMKCREECEAAISALHGKSTMAGAKSAIQVKFADTDRDRTAKKYQKAAAAQAAALYPGMPYPAVAGNPVPPAATAAAPMQLYHQVAALNALLNSAGAGAAAGATGTDQAALANLALYQQIISSATSVPQAPTVAGQQYPQQKEGPDGANLFIYHIPAEFRDPDLVQMFAPFGSVISARVFIDKATNQSKCFGFVSYATVEAAQSAIQSMNGFQIGTKRLKVSLKRGNSGKRPY